MKKVITQISAAELKKFNALNAAREQADVALHKYRDQIGKKIGEATNVKVGTILVRERLDYVNAFYRIESIVVDWYVRVGTVFYRASRCTKSGNRLSSSGATTRILANNNEYKIHIAK